MLINVETIQEIDKYIRSRSGGSHKVFADKLRISQSTLSRHIRFMNENGASIVYDFMEQTHYYAETGYFLIDIRFVHKKHVAKHKKNNAMVK